MASDNPKLKVMAEDIYGTKERGKNVRVAELAIMDMLRNTQPSGGKEDIAQTAMTTALAGEIATLMENDGHEAPARRVREAAQIRLEGKLIPAPIAR